MKPVWFARIVAPRLRGFAAGPATWRRGAHRLMGGLPASIGDGIRALAGIGPRRRLPFALAYRLRGRCPVLHVVPAAKPGAKPPARPR